MADEAGLSYVLPLRWRDDAGLDELTEYLRFLADRCEVIVVDASPEPQATRHREAWRGLARVGPPDPGVRAANGKARGVLAGVPLARHERVIIADDDVRYDAETLARTAALLDRADLVRPQNYFDPLPWHARWDTARSLLNRAVGEDYPGTLAIRRSRFELTDGYDGDVLFENLELIRTVRASGGRVLTPPDLYVRRLPPTTRHFLGQRVRQAYDEFARPARLALFLALVPAALAAPRRVVPVVAVGSVALAEAGRRRAGGRRVFPVSGSLLAPLWLAERAVCAWLAVWSRLRWGGVRYGDEVLRRAGTSERRLRRTLRR